MSGTIGASTPAATLASLDEKTADAATTGQVLLHERHTIPYWQVNVPPSEWTAECPSYLRDLPAKSIRCLSTLDKDYTRQDWDLVREIIRELGGSFGHRPSQEERHTDDGMGPQEPTASIDSSASRASCAGTWRTWRS